MPNIYDARRQEKVIMVSRISITSSLWVGVMSGIYVFLYLLSPLAEAGVLPVTFIALPIYLTGGAMRGDYLNACSSAVIGVAWGCAFIFLPGTLKGTDLSEVVAIALSAGFITVALCFLHMTLKSDGLFTNIPMMFGAVAATLMAGFDKWPYVAITLCLGITLGYINNLSSKFQKKDT